MADDVKKRSLPIRLVNQTQTEEQKYIEMMKASEVIDRKEASGSKVIRTRWVGKKKGTPETCSGSMGCTGFQMDG